MTKEDAADIIKGEIRTTFEICQYTDKVHANELSKAYNVMFDAKTFVLEHEEDDTSSRKFGAKRKVYYVRGF